MGGNVSLRGLNQMQSSAQEEERKGGGSALCREATRWCWAYGPHCPSRAQLFFLHPTLKHMCLPGFSLSSIINGGMHFTPALDSAPEA